MTLLDRIMQARAAQIEHDKRVPVQLELTEGVVLWATEDEAHMEWLNSTEPYHDENCWVACPHKIGYPYPDFSGIHPSIVLHDPKARD